MLDGVEVRLVDEAATTSFSGDAGEIWVKGPNVFKGYLDDPEADGARCSPPTAGCAPATSPSTDDDGYLYLVDRAKDLIIVSGFNVYPAEVEEVLAEHPGVAEVGVVGVPHPHTGEAVKAYVVPVAGRAPRRGQLIDVVPATTSPATSARRRCCSSTSCRATSSGKLVRRALV